jgi:hypothetical protein
MVPMIFEDELLGFICFEAHIAGKTSTRTPIG